MNEFEEDDGFEVHFDRFGYRRDQETYRRIRSTGVLNHGEEDVRYTKILDTILGFMHMHSYSGSYISCRKSTMKAFKQKAFPVDQLTKRKTTLAVAVLLLP